MSKDHALTHDENRFKVCLLCFRKRKEMFIIQMKLTDHVKSLFENYDEADDRIPGALCGSCKRNVSKMMNGQMQKIEFPDLSIFWHKPKATRSRDNMKCDCALCEIARSVPTAFSAKTSAKISLTV